MAFSEAHVAFVIAAYAVSFAGLMALVLYVFLRDRRLKRQAAALDHRKEGRHGRA
jgi:heme exporter protein CcmD